MLARKVTTAVKTLGKDNSLVLNLMKMIDKKIDQSKSWKDQERKNTVNI